jgi:hypothetical protein
MSVGKAKTMISLPCENVKKVGWEKKMKEMMLIITHPMIVLIRMHLITKG